MKEVTPSGDKSGAQHCAKYEGWSAPGRKDQSHSNPSGIEVSMAGFLEEADFAEGFLRRAARKMNAKDDGVWLWGDNWLRPIVWLASSLTRTLPFRGSDPTPRPAPTATGRCPARRRSSVSGRS